jgi:hypothetical protein
VVDALNGGQRPHEARRDPALHPTGPHSPRRFTTPAVARELAWLIEDGALQSSRAQRTSPPRRWFSMGARFLTSSQIQDFEFAPFDMFESRWERKYLWDVQTCTEPIHREAPRRAA